MKITFPIRSGSCVVVTSLAALIGLFLSRTEATPPESRVDFNRQIRPILSETCFACHGPDEKVRKAKLRLDTRTGLLNHPGLVTPGRPEESELLTRLTAMEKDKIMPPPKSGKKLTAQQIDLLRRWVAEGAEVREHWAFVPPQQASLPEVRNKAWVRNEVDPFVLARLEGEGLSPMPEAERATLLRRVTLDLTGLPPTPAELEAFLADTNPKAYEKAVQRLLHSPRYGEHMARYWLDIARYGDTHGLHLDNYREIWPYRDWVIRAFQNNKPYNQFVLEQLAGDLLPQATQEQIIATGYNRCHVTTSEGGSIEEEVYVRNVTDQVDTNATVFLGLTLGCARCHDHKFDPFTMKDYYSLFAFFNNIDGRPLDGNAAAHAPVVRVTTPAQAQALAKVEDKIRTLRKTVDAEVARYRYDPNTDSDPGEKPVRADFVWIDDAVPMGAKTQVNGSTNVTWTFAGSPQQPVRTGSASLRLNATGLQQLVLENASPGLRVGAGDTLFAHVFLDPKNPPKEIMLQWYSEGWNHRAYWGENLIPWGRDESGERRKMGPLPKAGEWIRLDVPIGRVGIKPGTLLTGWAFTQHDGTAFWDHAGVKTQTLQDGRTFETLSAWVRAARAGPTGLPKEIQDLVKLEPAQRTAAQTERLWAHFVEHIWGKSKGQLAPLRSQLVALDKEKEALEKGSPTTLVYKERTDLRPAYVLKRGEYDQRGDVVTRAVPTLLSALPQEAPLNRLGFAQWLVSGHHPLTARVAINRLWQQVFGVGLVKTGEDFGAQGEPPSHPELLDWLAIQFVKDGWDIKKTLERLVTSAAYRQSGKVTVDRLNRDPGNRLLSRGPRQRLDAEMLRDQALFVSGLLVEKQGGPSVRPPQPSGLWEAVGYTSSNTARFTADTGPEKVHRRSLYIFWKRTSPPPQMTTFDAPSREFCTPRRERTNTPLQALLLMNEVQYVEAARALAQRGMREGGPDRIATMFLLATGRRPKESEIMELTKAFQELRATFVRDPEAAKKLISVGETKPIPTLDPVDLAALTMIGNVLLNLDEVVTKG